MWDLTLSLNGIYNEDPEILDQNHLILPEDVDRTILLPMILSETAELEVLYPDPAKLKIVMQAWSRARCPSWERMFAALEEEYNPLYNYDRTEEESGETAGSDSYTETEAIHDSTEEDITDTTAEDVTDKTGETVRDTSTSTSSSTETGSVTGFNSQTFADADKTVNSGSASGTAGRERDQELVRDRDQTVSRDRDETSVRDRETGRTGTTAGSHSRTLRAYGNIGTTKTQEMLQDEINIRILDIYRLICDELTAYFCLRVY